MLHRPEMVCCCHAEIREAMLIKENTEKKVVYLLVILLVSAFTIKKLEVQLGNSSFLIVTSKVGM